MAGQSRLGLAALLALALALLLTMVARDSLRLVGGSFPGFLVWDNGTLVSFHTATWTGAQAGLPLNGGRVVVEVVELARVLSEGVARDFAPSPRSSLPPPIPTSRAVATIITTMSPPMTIAVGPPERDLVLEYGMPP